MDVKELVGVSTPPDTPLNKDEPKNIVFERSASIRFRSTSAGISGSSYVQEKSVRHIKTIEKRRVISALDFILPFL